LKKFTCISNKIYFNLSYKKNMQGEYPIDARFPNFTKLSLSIV
jgi:hypothetical protein